MAERRPPSAVLGATDEGAMAALAAAAKRGGSVPCDPSIAGFDDGPIARRATPALTTVRQPVQEVTGVARRLLPELVAAGVQPIEPAPVRASTGPIPATVAG